VKCGGQWPERKFGTPAEETDDWSPLLRARPERPRPCRAAQQRDKLAPSKQAVPEIARIAVLGAGESPVTRVLWPETQNAVQSLRLEAHLFTVQAPAELSTTFEAIAQDNANGEGPFIPQSQTLSRSRRNFS
jgi:hypothetical protein